MIDEKRLRIFREWLYTHVFGETNVEVLSEVTGEFERQFPEILPEKDTEKQP